MTEKFIQVTSLSNGGKILVNVRQIGHFYESPEKIEYGKVQKPKHTKLGVTTHNNGGFEVKETVDEILKMIQS
jgi:hypothetical protein